MLSIFSSRELPECPCKAVGYGNRCSEAEIPGDIRILGRVGVSIASAGFREIPWGSAGRHWQFRVGPDGRVILKNPGRRRVKKTTSLAKILDIFNHKQ